MQQRIVDVARDVLVSSVDGGSIIVHCYKLANATTLLKTLFVCINDVQVSLIDAIFAVS